MPATIGTEFLVNTTTQGWQQDASVAGLRNGSFVVTWSDQNQSGAGGDASYWAVRGQRYSADGVRIGAEFLVNTITQGEQHKPNAAGLSSGGFVIIWQDYSRTGDDANEYAIRGQRYNADGVRIGTEFLVNTTTQGAQWQPSVASLVNGGFIVTWSDYSRTGGDASGWAVRGQRYNADGVRVGAEFLVNTTTRGEQTEPSVASLTSGGFVVTWVDDSQTGGDTSSYAVRGQRYNADGVHVGAEFLINTTTQGEQSAPSVANLASDGFVITWMDRGENRGDTSSSAVRGQRYNADGVRVGAEFLVNTTTQGMQGYSSTVNLVNGGFIVTWVDQSQTGDDTSSYAVRGQCYNADGTANGTEFLVNTTAQGEQYEPSAVSLANGSFVVTWSDNSQTSGDTSSFAIRAQIFSANRAPTVSTPIADMSAPEAVAFRAVLPENSFADADRDALSLQATLAGGAPLPAWLTFEAASRSFSGTPPAGSADLTVRVTATDPSGLQVTDEFTLATPVNAAPVRDAGLSNQEAPEGQSFRYQFPENAFRDADGDRLTYTANMLPGWLSFDAASRTFSGTPPRNSGDATVRVTAEDGRGGSMTQEFSITTPAPVNIAPTLSGSIPDQRAGEGAAFTYTVPVGLFTDADGDPLTYAATLNSGAALPDWLLFNPATRAFRGTVPANSADLTLRVTASDGRGGTVWEAFQLTTPAAAVTDSGNDSGDTLMRARNLGAIALNNRPRTVPRETIGTASDRADYFRFTVPGPATLSVRMNGLRANANLDLRSAADRVLASSAASGSEAESLSWSMASGTYYLSVTPAEGATPYVLSLSAVPVPDLGGNSLESAYFLGSLSATPRFITDYIGGSDTIDYYAVRVTRAGTLRLSLSEVRAGQPPLTFSLMTSRVNDVLATTTVTSAGDEIEEDVAPGVYYIRLRMSRGDTGYRLSHALRPIIPATTTARQSLPDDLTAGMALSGAGATASLSRRSGLTLKDGLLTG